MASQPPQRFVSQSPAPPSNTSSEATASGRQRESSVPRSTSSEDSQTVFLNHPASSTPSPVLEDPQKRIKQRPSPQSTPSTKEVRKCWICFGDETDDGPTASQWRSPCPCALTAHEACLLDWVADLEAPEKGAPPAIQCPQCKARITISRPQSLAVAIVRAIERVTGRLLIPSVLATLAGSVATAFWMHGLGTLYLLFGREDARRLLGISREKMISLNWSITLTIIPITLIASRTTHADSLLPVIPLFYFATSEPRREGPLWPPSAAFTMAALPYLRAFYYEFYHMVIAPKEKLWIKTVHPRAEEVEEADAPRQDHNQEGADNEVADQVNIQLDLEVELVDEDEGREQQIAPEPPVIDDAGRDPAQGGPDQPQNPPPNQPHQQGHPHPHPPHANPGGMGAAGFVVDVISSSKLVVGALSLPLISTAMGSLLKVALPRKWTIPPAQGNRYPAGFLQSRFGRTIAGGCIFLVLKDSLSLYSKYRLAQDHQKRRIVDYAAKIDKKASSVGS